jgi:hypothetical protein
MPRQHRATPVRLVRTMRFVLILRRRDGA